MKNSYALLFLFISFFGYGQTLKDIKYDSIVKIENTDLSLVYSKKKTAVWHDANFFVAKPTKNHFIFLEGAQLLVEVDFKQKDFYAIVEDDITGGYKRFFLANGGFDANILHSEFNESYLVMDSIEYTLSLTKLENAAYGFTIGEIGLQLNSHFLFITDFKSSYQDKFNEYPLMSIEYPGEDSISYEGNTVYPPAEIFPGVQNSGVYNTKEKYWTIKTNYSQLIPFQNNILVSTELDNSNMSLDTNSYYTLFQIDKYQSNIIRENITDNNLFVASIMTNYDSIQQLDDRIHYITYKNGKQGLIEYQLFQNNYDQTQKADFLQNLILEPINDFVYYSSSQDASITKIDDYYYINHYRYGEGTVSEDSIIKQYLIDETGNKIDINIGYETYYHDEVFTVNPFGFNQINDSLIIIADILTEYHEEYPLITQYGEDSMVVNENGEWNIVYPEAQPGEFHCGLYNLNQNKWIIKPNEYAIEYFGGNSVLVTKPNFNKRHIIQAIEYKSIYTLNGELIISNQTSEDLVTKSDNIEKLLLQNNEAIGIYNVGPFSNTNIPDTLINGPYYYKVTKRNKEKIVTLDYYKSRRIISTFSSYHNLILHDPQSKFNFYLNNNKTSLSFSILEDSVEMYELDDGDYKMEIYTVLDYEYILSALVVVTTDKGTSFYEFGMMKYDGNKAGILTDYKSRTKRLITITKSENEIIYNISNTNGRYHIYGEDYDNYGESEEDLTHEWEQEYAAVYRKTNENWNKVSPNYNLITKVPFGYICKTGSYNYVHSMYFGDEVLEQNTISASYILLDSTLNPIGYSDYYNFDLIEDLGFGLKICPVIDKDKSNTTEGHGNCFLVDYNGKPMCEAKYDKFELVDGKIYGIKDEIYKIDEEYGDLAWDIETGEPILLQKYERVLIGDYK
jgi:hypothetical protein